MPRKGEKSAKTKERMKEEKGEKSSDEMDVDKCEKKEDGRIMKSENKETIQSDHETTHPGRRI